jgi:hypothetical protein
MSCNMKSLVVVAFCLAGILFPQVATAATYAAGGPGPYTVGPFTAGTFQTPGDLGISLATFVQGASEKTSGTAFTVNGATFANAVSGQFSQPFQNNQTWTIPGQDNFADLEIRALAQRYAVSFGGQTVTGTIPALTLGQSYKLQLIIHDGDANTNDPSDRGPVTVNVGADTLTSFNANNVLGGYSTTTGVFLNYSFLGTGAPISASIVVPSGSAFILTAYDIQQIPVPEPATIGLAILGFCGVCAARRAAKRRSRG